MATAKVYACYKPECSHLPLKSFKKLVAHIRRTHSHDPNFIVTCGIPGCCKTYRLFSSFESHISRNHSELLEETEQANDEDISVQEDSECPDYPDALSSMDESDDSKSEDEENEEERREKTLRNMALFILKTRECNRLSQTAMNNVMDETRHLVSMSMKHFQSRVEKCVTKSGTEVGDVDGLRELLAEKPVAVEAIQTLSGSWRELNYLREHFKFVVSYI